jgi:hypothetical protein
MRRTSIMRLPHALCPVPGVPLLARRTCRRRSMESVLILEYNDDFRWFGFVGRQTSLVPIAPVGKVYHRRNWRARKGIIAPLYDVQSVPVQKVGVVAEHFVQFWNHWMVVGDHVSFELGQSLFDLSGIKFHNALH